MNIAIWIWAAILAILIGGYWAYKNGKLGKVKLPSFSRKPTVEQIEAQTEKEVTRAKELRGVLEAKRELAKARAESIKLRKEIDGVSAKSVEKEKAQEKLDEQKAQELQKVKPRRL